MTATDRGRRSDALYYDNVGMQRRRLCDMIANLESDNAELRELVRELRVCLKDECNRCHEWGDICDLEHQMRELGVEANDG